jgi:hypothetical protein
MISLALVSLTIAFALCCISVQIRSKYVPGIPRHKSVYFGLFGDIPHLLRFLSQPGCKSPIRWINSLGANHGPICQVVVGPRCMITISDDQEIEDILTRRKEFDRSQAFIECKGLSSKTRDLNNTVVIEGRGPIRLSRVICPTIRSASPISSEPWHLYLPALFLN